MSDEIKIFVDLLGSSHMVGELWVRNRDGRQSASFQYAESWLESSLRFPIDPFLPLGEGPYHTPTERSLFGAIGDSSPDRWGRALMRRAERQDARKDGRTPRTLLEIDFLLQVNDYARQGALRFSKDGSIFLSNSSAEIPPIVDLPKLLSASEKVASDAGEDVDIRLLLAPGSSLGGARPKASVVSSTGELYIAKFPHSNDEIDTVKWEALSLTLAGDAKMTVPMWQLKNISEKSVLLLNRFDRNGNSRIPYMSAMSMLGAGDNESHNYLEIADAIRQMGASPKKDLKELWRRIVFSVLISNTDDHLRNHAFLRLGSDGWSLSPAFDLNPVPIDIKPRNLTTAIEPDNTQASLELAIEAAGYFDLNEQEAVSIVKEVAAATSKWREKASSIGINSGEIKRMSSAFEHSDLEKAQNL